MDQVDVEALEARRLARRGKRLAQYEALKPLNAKTECTVEQKCGVEDSEASGQVPVTQSNNSTEVDKREESQAVSEEGQLPQTEELLPKIKNQSPSSEEETIQIPAAKEPEINEETPGAACDSVDNETNTSPIPPNKSSFVSERNEILGTPEADETLEISVLKGDLGNLLPSHCSTPRAVSKECRDSGVTRRTPAAITRPDPSSLSVGQRAAFFEARAQAEEKPPMRKVAVAKHRMIAPAEKTVPRVVSSPVVEELGDPKVRFKALKERWEGKSAVNHQDSGRTPVRSVKHREAKSEDEFVTPKANAADASWEEEKEDDVLDDDSAEDSFGVVVVKEARENVEDRSLEQRDEHERVEEASGHRMEEKPGKIVEERVQTEEGPGQVEEEPAQMEEGPAQMEEGPEQVMEEPEQMVEKPGTTKKADCTHVGMRRGEHPLEKMQRQSSKRLLEEDDGGEGERADEVKPLPPAKHRRIERAGQEGASLVQTLSFYRRQRPVLSSELLKMEEEGQVEEEEGEEETEWKHMREEAEYFEKEAERQLQQMQQAASAVRISRTNSEQQDTLACVEAERVFFMSTAKHQAARDEARLLRQLLSEGRNRDESVGKSRGFVSLSHLTLPLKPAFLRKMADGQEEEEEVHHFLIMVRFRGQVSFTQMLSTNSSDTVHEGSLSFPNLINFQGLPHDFQLELQVLTIKTKGASAWNSSFPGTCSGSLTDMATPKRGTLRLSSTPKHRGDGHNRSRIWTPIKKWTSDSLASPIVFGTPRPKNSAVEKSVHQGDLKSGFNCVGRVILTVRNITEHRLALRGVPEASPLVGTLVLKARCSSASGLKFQGFMHLFEDIKGLGAWGRRWFVLDGTVLSMWRYPEEQAKREPSLITIDLRECITDEFRRVRTDRCARSNTFLLAIGRPALPGDTAGLCVERKGAVTIVSYLLSCDTEEKFQEWCTVLGNALKDIRSWDPDAALPRQEGSPDYLPSC